MHGLLVLVHSVSYPPVLLSGLHPPVPVWSTPSCPCLVYTLLSPSGLPPPVPVWATPSCPCLGYTLLSLSGLHTPVPVWSTPSCPCPCLMVLCCLLSCFPSNRRTQLRLASEKHEREHENNRENLLALQQTNVTL